MFLQRQRWRVPSVPWVQGQGQLDCLHRGEEVEGGGARVRMETPQLGPDVSCL